MTDLQHRLVEYAQEAGFAKVGFCRPDATPDLPDRLAAFVDAGMHGQMGWMAERMAWRGSAAALWPEAKTVIMLAEPYTPAHDPMAVFETPDAGAISVYAQNRDYHDIVKKRLKAVGRWLIAQMPDAQIKVFVTTVEFEPNKAEESHCGSCTACLDVCPTDAFPAPYRLDARRCISYLTIEHKGPVDLELRAKMGGHIYGCDDCLAACPWNKFAVEARELRYAARPDLVAPPLAELAGLDDAAFRERFSGSPVKRIGRDRFVRNVAYAIGNSGDQALLGSVLPLLDDADEAVADAARWAVERLT